MGASSSWETLFRFHDTFEYQMGVFPFALLFHYLCITWNLSLKLRYVFLLAGGVLLASVVLGWYACLLFASVACSIALIHSAGPEQVHTWVFFFQMTWQTLCHLWLHYKEYYQQEAVCARFSIALASLMLMTQKITSLTLDIHEKKVKVRLPRDNGRTDWGWYQLQVLPFCSYLLSFPSLLGGPLCSFNRFQMWIKYSQPLLSSFSLWVATQKALHALTLGFLKNILWGNSCPQDDLVHCAHFGCVYVVWKSALLFKLAYYSDWMIGESLFLAAGMGQDLGRPQCAEAADRVLMDTDVWALETSNMIAAFTRTWNKSTTSWLKRLIFQQSSWHPLLATFAFSAWWHGLHPGQVFGFLCWAAMVEADYRFHHVFGSMAKSCSQKLLYWTLTWCHTQIVMAYIMVAVEMRSFRMLWCLSSSYCSIFPLIYIIAFFLLEKKRLTRPPSNRSHT